jgi:hypothetical protein
VIENLFPGEYAKLGVWTPKHTVNVFARRGDRTKVSFRLRPGEHFTAAKSDVIVGKPGKVLVTRDFHPQFGPNFRRGDIVYLLTPSGEGEWEIWYHNKHQFTTYFWNEDEEYDPERHYGRRIGDEDPHIWVFVRTGVGRTGWLADPRPDDIDGMYSQSG